MNKSREIDALYKILALYEDIGDEQSPVDIDGYLNYIDKLYVKWLGIGNSDIYGILKGLWMLRDEVDHKRVKSMVFHMINIIERDE